MSQRSRPEVSSAVAYRDVPLYIPDMPRHSEIAAWLEKIDENRWYTNFGPLNQSFEDALLRCFASLPSAHLTTVANATLGLELALAALDLPPGSHVLIPAFTFVATATAVARAGLIPVLADVDAESWLLTPEVARATLKYLPIRAVMPVAALGCPQPVSAWDAYTAETGIPVVIDAAAAFGSQPIGDTTAVVYSLHATKNLGIGEGGIVAGADREFIERIRKTSNFGLEGGKIRHVGTNAKLSEYHAAVGLAMLDRWQGRKEVKRGLFHAYRSRLDGMQRPLLYQRGAEQIIPPLLAIRLPGQNDVAGLAERLRERGIQTRRWYHPPLHQHPAFAEAPRAGDLPNTRQIAKQILGLPFHLQITPEDMDYTVLWLDRLWS